MLHLLLITFRIDLFRIQKHDDDAFGYSTFDRLHFGSVFFVFKYITMMYSDSLLLTDYISDRYVSHSDIF